MVQTTPLPTARANGRRLAATAVVGLLLLGIAACNSPTVPSSPTPSGLPGQSQSPGQSPGVTSTASGSPGTGTPGPTGTVPPQGSPTPFHSRIGPDPCRLLTTDEVNAALGGGFLAGGGQGIACVFPSIAQGANASLVSVAAVDGDQITPIKLRYPDLVDLSVSNGTAEWSPSVATLWLVIDGPKTIEVSILGSQLSDDDLQAIALQLAQLAAGRV